MHDARSGAWVEECASELAPGDAFAHNGPLLGATEDGVEVPGEAALEEGFLTRYGPLRGGWDWVEPEARALEDLLQHLHSGDAQGWVRSHPTAG